ncbi:MAG: hypothetical protein II401_10985 [Bacteroidales bacterium]|nr:hypothetical protein [Bacteroidales bacterium]
MKEELTTAMHAEFTVSEINDKINRASCVWCYGLFETEAEQKKAAADYGLTWEEALQYKEAALKGQRHYPNR